MEKEKSIDKSRIATKDYNEAILCKLCGGAMDDPVECDVCNTGFCRSCLKSWLNTHTTCPNKCTNFNIKKVHVLIRNMLDELEIRCKYAENGCTQVVKYEYLKKHEDSCEYKFAKCKYFDNGCKQMILLKDLKQHEDSCGYELLKCEKGCEQSILKKDLETHSCIKYLRSIVDKYQTRIKSISAEVEKGECDLYNANYKNVGYLCDSCHEENFAGISYRCTVCDDFDFCKVCYKTQKHPHTMRKIFPVSFYTQCTKRNIVKNDSKFTLNVTVLVKNYNPVEYSIKFKTTYNYHLEYTNNDFFPIKSGAEVLKTFSFVISANSEPKKMTFYIEISDNKRFNGLPFTINID